MADGGRKFNVWIAYSDLFSNLMTFLFISAFGMFAAIGSGVMFNGQGSIDVLRSECIAPQSDVDSALRMQLPGLSSDLGEPDIATVCETTYAVNNPKPLEKELRDIWADHPGTGHRKSLTPLERIETNPRLMHNICPQLWAAAALKPMRYLKGHLEILAALEAPMHSEMCAAEVQPPPEKIWLPFRKKAEDRDRPYRVAWVESCFTQISEGRWQKSGRDQAHIYKELSSICDEFKECFVGAEHSPRCDDLKSMLSSWQADQDRCQIQDAVKRASLLYEACRIAIRSNGFSWSDAVDTPNSMLQGRNRDFSKADDTWTHRVRYGAEMDGDGASSSRRSGFVVKVVFEPKEVDDWMNPKDNAELSGWTTEELPAK